MLTVHALTSAALHISVFCAERVFNIESHSQPVRPRRRNNTGRTYRGKTNRKKRGGHNDRHAKKSTKPASTPLLGAGNLNLIDVAVILVFITVAVEPHPETSVVVGSRAARLILIRPRSVICDLKVVPVRTVYRPPNIQILTRIQTIGLPGIFDVYVSVANRTNGLLYPAVLVVTRTVDPAVRLPVTDTCWLSNRPPACNKITTLKTVIEDGRTRR